MTYPQILRKHPEVKLGSLACLAFGDSQVDQVEVAGIDDGRDSGDFRCALRIYGGDGSIFFWQMHINSDIGFLKDL